MPEKKIPPAFQPPGWDPADALAVQACVAGTATPEQQKRAIDWIVFRAAGTDDVDYRPDEREHVFVSGRRFVGLQIRKLTAINVGAFNKE